MGTPLPSVAFALSLLVASSSLAVTFAKIEASFELPDVKGNPFDFETNDVRVTLTAPDGKTITLPAFFDGGTTWRVRHLPTAAGKWTVGAIALNGADAKPQHLEPRTFDVVDKPVSQPTTLPTITGSGYVRIDPKDKMRFATDDGQPFYPVGYDLAWHHTGEPKMPPLVESLGRMKAAGVNWTRIWMDAWDGKNLDWAEPPMAQPKLGELSLEAAKQWDGIVDAADAGNIHFQLVLQHHGQYSTTADTNWPINPWNTANGGFLADPAKFFVDEKAKSLTRAKYRYILARWGYSPAIMAWELFNEVQFTDAFKSNLDDVAAWHVEMAKFIRDHDAYHHLITTSSQTAEPKLWPATDYYQEHVYAPDLATAVQTLDSNGFDKPYFYGEVGSNAFGTQSEPGNAIHTALWASLMTRASGAAQYWYWYEAEPRGLLYHFTAVQNFLRASNVLERRSTLKPIEVIADTGKLGTFHFGPGIGWGPSKGTSFTVKRSGFVEGLGGMSGYLQGVNDNRAMFPFAEFNVDFPDDGTFSVHVDEITPTGGTLNVAIDGKPTTSLKLDAPPTRPDGPATRQAPRNPRLNTTLELNVPAGKHVVRLENTGTNWVHLSEFKLTPYAPGLAVLAKASNDYAVMWVYRREAGDESSMHGTLTVPGIDAGDYRVVWFDTTKGTPIREAKVSASGGALKLESGDIASDVAIFITRAAAAS